jgi:TolB-like protein
VSISWPVIRTRLPALRTDLDDMGDQNLKNIIRTVKVYRVRVVDTETTAPSITSKPTPPDLAVPDKPSIAVLPFQNMSGDAEQEYFVDGMVEEIITALSRIRWLFVIARNSSFTYKGEAVDAKRVARELGVRYVLEGSVRKAGNRVRITGQLIDTETGAHLWADRFDGSLEDVFELQDTVALSVAGVIEPALQAAEIRRSSARPMTDLTAYDLYLQAVAVVRHVTSERVLKALGLIEQAIAIDRLYGPALSLAALCHMRLVTDGWAIEPSTNRREAVNFARRALQAAENDPRILANSAEVLAIFGEDIGAMIGLIDRALALNPSFALGWNVSGLLRLYAGQPDLAIGHLETSLRLSPRERIGRPLYVMGAAYFLKREFDEAAAKLVLAIQDDPGFPATYRVLAACYAHMGRLDEAHAIVATLRAITPQIVPSVLPWRNPEDRELLLTGLRIAGGTT